MTRLFSALVQGLHVFGEAAAAVSDAGEQESRSDACVGAHATTHHVHVSADELAEVGDLIHERDFGGQEGIRGVLGQFSTALVHEQHGVALAHVGLVEFFHHLASALARATHHNAVGLHEIVHSKAFSQKLGIRHHVKIDVGMSGHGLSNLVCRPYWDGALVHDDFVGRHDLAQFICDAEDVTQVGRTVFARRRGQGQKHNVRVVHGFLQVCRERKASRGDVAVEQRVQVGLVDGHLAGFHGGHLGLVDVDANHVVARLCEARSCDKSNVSSSNYGDIHEISLGQVEDKSLKSSATTRV